MFSAIFIKFGFCLWLKILIQLIESKPNNLQPDEHHYSLAIIPTQTGCHESSHQTLYRMDQYQYGSVIHPEQALLQL